MAQNRTLNIPPIEVPTAAANILNCAVTSLAGPVGLTLTQPYLLVKHIRVTNRTAGALTFTLWKGATGASANGTEWLFQGITVPANSYVDAYVSQRLDAADFITGLASGAGLVITFDGEVGFA